MEFQVIASGSKGNMTYIKTENTSILIDSGISLKEANSRINYEITNVDAILITHEHIDHVKYIEDYDSLNIPIYGHANMVQILQDEIMGYAFSRFIV